MSLREQYSKRGSAKVSNKGNGANGKIRIQHCTIWILKITLNKIQGIKSKIKKKHFDNNYPALKEYIDEAFFDSIKCISNVWFYPTTYYPCIVNSRHFSRIYIPLCTTNKLLALELVRINGNKVW